MLIWLGKQLLRQTDQVEAKDKDARESIENLRIELERKLARIDASQQEEALASQSDE